MPAGSLGDRAAIVGGFAVASTRYGGGFRGPPGRRIRVGGAATRTVADAQDGAYGGVLANALIWTSHSTPDVFDRAEALFAQGQTDQAAETYRELLSVNPFAAPAWLRLAGIARTKGRVEDALSLTYAAHQVEPHTLRTIWPLVEAELQAGQVDSAVARLASLVAHKPDLRPAAYLTAHRGGAPIPLIETRLADEEPYAAGEYLAFLTRIGAWDRWSVAHKRFEKNLGDAHRRFLDQAVAERQSALDHSAGR